MNVVWIRNVHIRLHGAFFSNYSTNKFNKFESDKVEHGRVREMVESNHINLNHNGFQGGNKMLKILVFGTYVVYVFRLSALSFSALRDNRIQLVKSTATELIITIAEVQLSDDGEYTCSIFTMPVRTARATVTVLGKCV